MTLLARIITFLASHTYFFANRKKEKEGLNCHTVTKLCKSVYYFLLKFYIGRLSNLNFSMRVYLYGMGVSPWGIMNTLNLLY